MTSYNDDKLKEINTQLNLINENIIKLIEVMERLLSLTDGIDDILRHWG